MFALNNTYSVQVYTHENLSQLQNAWDQCAANNGSYYPFLCFDWFTTWLKHFPETDLHIPVLYENGAVAAIMPMMRKIVKKRGIPLRVYAFAANAYSQTNAVIHNTADPEKRVQQLKMLLQYFREHASSWDYLDLHALQTENGNSKQIMQAADHVGLGCVKEVAYINCYQDSASLPLGEFLKSKKKVRKNVPYFRRRMQREGELQFRYVKTGEKINTIMDSYYQLYAKSWKQSEDLGPFFHRDLAVMAADKGWLRLGFLDFNSQPIACQLWLVHDTAAYTLKIFYDEVFKHYSPGTVLTESMMHMAIEQDKVHAIDFLQGDEPYKRDWLDMQRVRERVVIFGSTIKARIAGFVCCRTHSFAGFKAAR